MSFTLSFTTPEPIFTLAIDQTGSTTSTICPLPVPSGSFFPIVIVVAELLLPDLSVAVPSGNDSDILPLYVYPSLIPSWPFCSKFPITNRYFSPTFTFATPFTVSVTSPILVSVFVIALFNAVLS